MADRQVVRPQVPVAQSFRLPLLPVCFRERQFYPLESDFGVRPALRQQKEILSVANKSQREREIVSKRESVTHLKSPAIDTMPKSVVKLHWRDKGDRGKRERERCTRESTHFHSRMRKFFE